MAYSNGHSCARATFGGHACCASSARKYQRLADISSLPVKAINGSWSGLEDSAGTHRGGGAMDFEADGMSSDHAYLLAKQARSVGLLAWPRIWDGNHHVHTEDPDCQTLSAAARDQFSSFANGHDATATVNADPLGLYNRTAIMAAYNARMRVGGTAPAKAPGVSPAVAVDLTSPISVKNLKPRARNNDVARFEKALWNYLGADYRRTINANAANHGKVGDGYYGSLTELMCSDAYARAGLGRANYPGGTVLLSRLGFTHPHV